MIRDNIRSFASGILHRCKCKVKPEYKLSDLGLVNEKMRLFKETITNNYKITLTEDDTKAWVTLNDVILTVETKVIS